MRTVDREGFILWTEGYFLYRNEDRMILVPETRCEAAVDALNRGEKVALTVDGEIVSYLIPKDGQFLEVLE